MLVLLVVFVCPLRVKEVVHRQPETFAVPKEQPWNHYGQYHADDELEGQRGIEAVEREPGP